MHRPTLLGALATAAVISAAVAGPTARAGTSPAPPSTSAKASSAKASFRQPTVPGWPISNPGVIHTQDSHGSRYVVLETGGATQLGTISVATDPDSRAGWTRLANRQLLDRVPRYAAAVKGVWAPSGTYVPAQHRYYTFYSAPVAGHTGDAKFPPRCLFVGKTMTDYLDPAGDTGLGTAVFKAVNKPLVCWRGSGAPAGHVIGRPDPGFSLIDPTPTWIGQQLFLLYKTQFKRGSLWHSTIRMTQLNPAKPTQVLKDRPLTSYKNVSIEENPVLVKHAGRYVLFTSRGWYHSACTTSPHPYHSVFRTSGNKWVWGKSVTTLPVPKGTCGTGNAQPVGNRYFFNGRWKTVKGPLHLYVGRLAWKGDQPRVTKLFP
jgi:hypothetical protein